MPGSSSDGASRVDLLLTGGLVVDGTGADPYPGDVAVTGDTVVRVRQATTAQLPLAADTIVDCAGLVVSPGFVDIHTHSDLSFLLDPGAPSKVAQGVTTEVVGNCGFSAFPAAPGRREALAEFLCGLGTPRLPVDWHDFDGYAAAVTACRPVMNLAPLLGHGALRIAVAGNGDVPAGTDLRRRLVALLRTNLRQGAFGLSTGLTYVPSRFAAPAEIHALAAEVARHGGLYATHARATPDPRAAVDEAVEVGRRTGVRVQFSHVALNDPHWWGRAGEMIERFDAARAEGVDVRYDVYPYAASASSLTQYLPGWVQERGEAGLRDLLADPAAYRRAQTELARGLYGEISWDWQRVVISLAGPGDEDLAGATVSAAADRRGRAPEQLCLDLCARHGNLVQVVLHYRQESDVAAFLAHPGAIVGSDGRAMPVTVTGRPHPRSFGTFPRLLARYVRQQQVLTLAEAVHRVSGAPATRLGLRRRGVIAPGGYADLVVLDPDRIADTATFTEPAQLAVGVQHVWINGRPVVTDQRVTGQRPGRVLRHGQD